MKRYRLNKATLVKNLLVAMNVAFLVGAYVYVVWTLPSHITVF